MSQQQQQPPAKTDTTTEILMSLVKLVFFLTIGLVLLPLAVPYIVATTTGNRIAKRHAFWMTYRWHALVNVVTVAIVAAVVTVEAVIVTRWIASGDAKAFTQRPDWIAELAGAVWPWLLVNLLLGVLLLPITWTIRRRRIAEMVRRRMIPDVLTQEHIESARKRAADMMSARQLGVQLDPRTGAISAGKGGGIDAPAGAIGLVSRATVSTFAEKFIDKREVLDWTDQTGRFITLPAAAGAIRVMQLAESGSGKTVLMYHGITEVLRRGWPVYFIDAKGDPEDADQLAELAQALGYTVRIGEPWNLYTGTASQITTKILRTIPLSTGDGAFYRREAEQALRAIQSKAPLTGMRDLFTRLDNPREYVRDQTQLNSLMAPVDKIGTKRNERIRDTLLTALEPLEPYLSASGWSYGDGGADLTIVPLSPADEAEARVGDLMLLDLRQWMTTRLRGRDKSPGVVFVDEFAQLVTADSDPGDTAGSMFETARSAGLGLWLAVQSVAGISNDETRRERALSSGAALLFGRSKKPEDVVSYAGTVMRLEASGAATGEELRSARAQHTYVVPPQDVRQASIGQFWLVQSGGLISGRALPPKKAPAVLVAAPPVDELPADELPADELPADELPATKLPRFEESSEDEDTEKQG
ncbi:hypothetical protein [Microbacterium sp. Ag1]|uniref:hypothetical protein n=1 Tax=Microbacterium sp. Ag1 TaxID=1643443 RepID=UPI0012E0B2A7|nr:hypothetical protein [Microbacterium sp. Ag1]